MKPLSFTWLGHSTFLFTSPGGKRILIEPWVASNPACPESAKKIGHLDLILITHGHSDHAGDAVAIARATGAHVIANYEICLWLESKGIQNTAPMGCGGTQRVGDIAITMTNALHTSSIEEDGKVVPLGNPAGFVVRFEDGLTIYFAGDTDLFGDMRLIGEMHRPTIAFLPIGDRFTMGPAAAARAVDFLGAKQVVPMHYGTFPFLTGTVQQLRELVEPKLVQVLELKPGGNRFVKIRYDVADGVATIELNDPPANAYSYEMMREIDAAVLDARMDRAVHVIVVRGAGEKFFCAGANIGMLKDADPEFKYYFCLHANETLNRFEQTPKLVIAALNGHTVGGGLEVALAADIRIARKDAGKIGLPEVALGVLPGTGGTQRLARLVGKSRAIELMTMGRLMSMDEAKTIGLVNDVWDAPDFRAAIHDYAKQFTPPNKASKAVGRIKRAVQSGSEMSFNDGLALERELQQQLFESNDAREGITANIEKRKPFFKGE